MQVAKKINAALMTMPRDAVAGGRGKEKNTNSFRPCTLYRFWGASDELLYIGITTRGAQRFNEHRDGKEWWGLVTNTTLEHFPSRKEAESSEANAIRNESPIYNKTHNSGAA